MRYGDRMQSHDYENCGQRAASGPSTVSFVPPSTPAPHHGFRRSSVSTVGASRYYYGSLKNNDDAFGNRKPYTSGDRVLSDDVDREDNSAKKASRSAIGATSDSGHRSFSGLSPQSDSRRLRSGIFEGEEDELYNFGGKTTLLSGIPGEVGTGPGFSRGAPYRLNGALGGKSVSQNRLLASDNDEGVVTGGRSSDVYSLSPRSEVEIGAALSQKQLTRFNEYMQASPLNHRQAQLKVLELFQYWLTSPGVRPAIDATVQEAIGQISDEREHVKLAWEETPVKRVPVENGKTSSTAAGADIQRQSADVAGELLRKREEKNGASSTQTDATKESVKEKVTLFPEVISPEKKRITPPSPRQANETPVLNNAPKETTKCELLSPGETAHPKHSSASDENTRGTDGALHVTLVPPISKQSALGDKAGVEGSSPDTGGKGNPSAEPPKGCSYEEIPRFYFPLGRPTTRERTLTGPISRRIENPHLKITEGVALTGAVLDVTEGGNAALSDSMKKTVSSSHRGSKVAPFSALRCVDDRSVHQHIQKEFTRVPPPPKLSQKGRLAGNRARGSPGSVSMAKQEANYKHQLLQCIQRICVQCFGVPRYFAFIIVRLIQADVATTSNTNFASRATGSRSGSTTSLLAPANPNSGTVTAQHVKDFYDTFLKNKDSLRRTFDLLILSSKSTEKDNGNGSLGSYLDPQTLRPFLLAEDFVSYINVLLVQHPGLSFLRQTPDFQSKYLDTVIYRIFYEVDRLDRGSISFAEFANSRLMDAFRQVDASDDINSVLLFFSYEHFYVLYCRFWELDEDRDMMLSPTDFRRYAPEDVMNPLIVERVFSGAGRRLRCSVKGFIGYEDFVWFCLSEEDKSTPPAIRYWFRILDLDGDGILSVYELKTFYDTTKDKIAQYVQDGAISFNDVICQVVDMMRCQEYRGLMMSDFLREPEAAYVCLNMLTSVVKFLQFEQRDPFVAHQERLLGGVEQTPWDRFARIEYDRMAQEADE